MKNRPFIKICGITRLADANFAVSSGADAIGFIAFPKSSRYITADRVKDICANLPEAFRKAGVFVDADFNTIKVYVAAGITTIQLHGNETADFAKECQVLGETWKALKPETPEQIQQYIDFPADKFLIDAFHKELPGGTGLTVDRELAKLAVEELNQPVILAGGLTPANFAEILSDVKPFGLDFNSGLESSPGVKDYEKISAVFERMNEREEAT